MASRRLLIAYAHPDDESFGLGGLITKYVREGVEVYLICATNGDVGTVDPDKMAGYSTIAELRLSELDRASELLGFKHVYKLGYKDSGMMGSATSEDPASLWQAPIPEVTRRVVEVIREVRPQVIVTFNRYGGYGHPDHIAIQRATELAFSAAGEASYETGQEPYHPEKFYYSGMPKQFLRFAIAWMRLRGQDPRKLGRNQDIDMQMVYDNIEPTHALVDVSKFFKEWDAASACHVSQLGGRTTTLPMFVRKVMSPKQNFTRIYPAPKANRVDEHDLFAGVKGDDFVFAPASAEVREVVR